ncbi:SDR family NAD(P)-dependent oxidoreductase [Saliterribacillus persicus]|uniref:Short-subunit dehydrogenase n=1 Tax=Saliterribacillus persicus TaxID=930114 RepID=A0A368XFQ4_9BACI|nr:SDR family oxidoreductase [Saliterribacillus persicus]RCW64844.1 hypothetical protein DFR57_11221 [Saliterribacillus persicus]
MSNLLNKRILITGASSGIGESLAYSLAKAGSIVILVARSEQKLLKIKQEIEEESSASVYTYAVDITDTYKWMECLQRIIDDIGTLDAIINNAGMGLFEELSNMDWNSAQKMIDLNLTALIKTTHFLIPHLDDKEPAHIVNISSQAGKIATPKSSVYSATKFAVIGFSNALRLELAAKNIYVTTVNIGPVRTNFFNVADPSGKYKASVDRFMLEPEEVSKKIQESLFTKKREINLPMWMNMASTVYQLFPKLVELLFKKQFNQK